MKKNTRGAIEQMVHTCSLDVAEHLGAITLMDVGKLLNITRERVRQIEAHALAKLHRWSREAAGRGDDMRDASTVYDSAEAMRAAAESAVRE